MPSITESLDPALHLHQSEPLNAELSLEALARQERFLTPTHLLFHRNHDPLVHHPADKGDEWSLKVEVQDSVVQRLGCDVGTRSQAFTVGDLKQRFEQHTVVATLEVCVLP